MLKTVLFSPPENQDRSPVHPRTQACKPRCCGLLCIWFVFWPGKACCAPLSGCGQGMGWPTSQQGSEAHLRLITNHSASTTLPDNSVSLVRALSSFAARSFPVLSAIYSRPKPFSLYLCRLVPHRSCLFMFSGPCQPAPSSHNLQRRP